MSAALRSEFRKLFSTRMWWVLGLVMVLYLGFMGAFMGYVMSDPMMMDAGDEMLVSGPDMAISVYSLTNPLGYAFPLIIGTLIFTGEFRHRTMIPTLLSDPNRTRLMLAKLVVSAVVGTIFGLLAVAGLLAGATPFLHFVGDGSYLGDAEVLKVLGSSVLVFLVWSMLGTVLGALIVNQIAAIVIILVMTQLVEPLMRIGLMVWEPTRSASKYLPGSAGDAIVGGSGLMGPEMSDAMLSRPAGLAVLLGYVVVFGVLGRVFTLRRDVS